jgi:predicted permease
LSRKVPPNGNTQRIFHTVRIRLNVRRLIDLVSRSPLSQNHWAMKLGISRGHISELLNGKHPYPSAKTRQKLLDGFSVPFDDLFEIEQEGDGWTHASKASFQAAVADRYLIDSEIGHGGMGTVYLARDVKHGRRVAVKVVSPEAVTGIGAPQFLKEIRYTARLQHHHILPLFDSGEAAGYPYYVMPYLRDGSLRQLLEREGRLSLATAVKLSQGIARGLAFAHRHHVIHCDVKPENVLRSEDHAFVADFGIARAVHAEALAWGKREDVDSSAGTPAYVSPEQAAGEHHLDGRSDVYSLGCMVFEMLTGAPPFGGTSTVEVVSRRFVDRVPDLRDYAPSIPAGVAIAVQRAMAIDPARRFDTVQQFANELSAASATARPLARVLMGAGALGRGVRRAMGMSFEKPRRIVRMDGSWQDFKLAFRMLGKRPGFTFTVLATLAMGIGATTALFGVFRAVFLAPIPLPESDDLVIVMGQGSLGCCGPASGPDYVDWVERNRSFSGLALMNPQTYTVTGTEAPERVFGMHVTASAFPMLGVGAVMGRTLLAEDENGGGTVLLSYHFWRNQLGGREDVVNSTVEVNGVGHTVVGVMPEGFDVPSPWSQYGAHRLYLPFQRERLGGNRGSHSWPVVGRLAHGATKETAQSDMDRVSRELAIEYPQTNADWSASVFSVHEYLFGAVGKQLGLILGAATLVLLIACGNVAGLLLARAAGRESELAIRAALGGSRGALVRLLFSEALVLALLGGIGGILLSFVAIDGLKALLPPTMPRADQIQVGGWALGFALGASAFTALAFGMVPALLAARSSLAANVKEGGYATLAPAKERLRNAFIVGQIALGLVLANGAALLVRSYASLRGQDFGFRNDGVVTMSLSPSGPRYQDDLAYSNYYNEVLARVEAIPGVEAIGTISRLPLFGGTNTNVWIEGTPPPQSPGEGPLVEVTSINGHYFEAMHIPLVRGRFLQPGDTAEAAPNVLINERFAEIGWPRLDPLGKRFTTTDDGSWWFTVVGVVGDVRQQGPEQPAQAQLYAPYVRGWTTGAYLTARTLDDASALVPRIREAVLAVDPSQPPSDVRMMSERVDRTLAQRRFYTTLITLFAAAALLLAAAGVYGTVSYFVARRVRELGIRVALGAPSSGIVGLVVGRGLRLAAWGVGFGLVGVWATTRLFESMVYEIDAVDPITIIGGSLGLALVAVVASAIPATRAVNVSPVLALRSK